MDLYRTCRLVQYHSRKRGEVRQWMGASIGGPGHPGLVARLLNSLLKLFVVVTAQEH
jgi:hypothetical protein